jgi:hypothetical protein
MDTTFADPQSKHDIHFVGCRDCHPGREGYSRTTIRKPTLNMRW